MGPFKLGITNIQNFCWGLHHDVCQHLGCRETCNFDKPLKIFTNNHGWLYAHIIYICLQSNTYDYDEGTAAGSVSHGSAV